MECKRVKMTKTISKKKIDVLISLAIRTYSKVISITLDRVLVQDMKKKMEPQYRKEWHACTVYELCEL